MRNFFKLFIFFVFFSLILPLPHSGAVIVLKTKDREALIHLEGLKTKAGAYFSAIDLYGQERGLVQIKQVAHSKAIGVLKQGAVAKRWSLEPVSRSKALAMQKKAKRKKLRLARIEREKIKRRKARLMARMERKKINRQNARNRRERQRKLAQKKQALRRKIASYDEGEYIINDFPEENNQSSEILSYNSESFDYENDQEESLFPEEEESSKNLIIGLAPFAEYSIMKVTPESSPDYSLKGYVYGANLLVDFPINHFIRAEGTLGYKKKDLYEEEKACGKSGGCSFIVDYLSMGLSLKLNLGDFNRHKLWLAGKGELFQPLVIPEENNTLTKESFDTIHGALGLSLGLDFATGDFIIPVSFSGSLHMPPTESVIMGNAGLQVALAYKF